MQEHLHITENADFKHLLSQGFSEIEASRIVYMKNHMQEEVEYCESVEETRRLSFLRWLVETGRIGS